MIYISKANKKLEVETLGFFLNLAGILCQSSTYGSSSFKVLVGVGVNTENMEPTICLRSIASEFVDPELISRETVLAEFFNSFEELHDTLSTKGFEPLKERYLRYWLHR